MVVKKFNFVEVLLLSMVLDGFSLVLGLLSLGIISYTL